MIRILKIAIAPLTTLLYWISGLIPRQSRRWIFGSYMNAFNDNSKHLYIHVVENFPEIEAIWITGDPKVRNFIRAAGGRACSRWSLTGLYVCLTGRYWFFNVYASDINYYCSRNATLVNLWHGIPLKKIEFDIENGPLADRYQRSGFVARHVFWPSIFKRPDFVLSTSDKVTRKSFASAFRVRPDQCLAFGYPRTDCFFRTASERTHTIDRWDPPETRALIAKISKFKRCLIYMPTWRDANPDFIERSGWDFPRLNAAFEAQGTLLLLKLHVATPPHITRKAANLSNIHLMKSTEDAYSVLPLTSALVTDYSSILFDYLLLDKPIYYYPFDRLEYEKDSRGFYYPYEQCIAGRVIQSPMELVEMNLDEDEREYAAARQALRDNFYRHSDASASERIVSKMLSL